MRRYVGFAIVITGAVLCSSFGHAQISVHGRVLTGTAGGLEPGAPGADLPKGPDTALQLGASCEKAPPPIQPLQLGRVQEIIEKAFMDEGVFKEIAAAMGFCYDAKTIDPSRSATLERLRQNIGMNFLMLDPKVQAYFNRPGDPQDKSYQKIRERSRRQEAYEKAMLKDGLERFITIGLMARSVSGEILYKRDCNTKNGSVLPYAKVVTKVMSNRIDLVNRKGECERTKWNHMIKDEKTGKFVNPSYKVSLATAHEIILSPGQFNTWDANDPSRFKALCPAQKAGQIQPIPDDEFEANRKREDERVAKGFERRPVFRFTVLGKEKHERWKTAVRDAMTSQLMPEVFHDQTRSVDPCMLFFTSGSEPYERYTTKEPFKSGFVPVPPNAVVVDRTPIRDPNCVALWKPAPAREDQDSKLKSVTRKTPKN